MDQSTELRVKAKYLRFVTTKFVHHRNENYLSLRNDNDICLFAPKRIYFHDLSKGKHTVFLNNTINCR